MCKLKLEEFSLTLRITFLKRNRELTSKNDTTIKMTI